MKNYEIFSLVVFCSVSLLAQTNVSGAGMISVSYHGQESFYNFILPEAYGQTPEPYLYRGDSYQDIDMRNGTHVWTGGLPVYVDSGGIDTVNGKPSFVPYILDDQITHTTFETGSISWTFHKDTCTWQLYEGGRIAGKSPVIENISITFQEKVGQSWQNLPHNNETCNVVVNTLPDDTIQLIATQGNPTIGYTEIELIQRGGYDLETWYRSPVDTVGGKEYGFVESHIKNQDVTFNGQSYGLNIAQDVILQKSEFRSSIAGFDIDIPIIAENQNGKVTVNLKDTVHNTLTDSTVKKYQVDKLQTFFNFHNTNPLNQGERLEIDPTYSSTNPTQDGSHTDQDDGCNGDVDNSDSTGSFAIIGDGSSGTAGVRIYAEWDITSIPDGSVVSDTDWEFDYHGGTSPPSSAEINPVTTYRPSTASANNVFTDLGDGTPYVDPWTANTAANQVQDLGSSADSDVESQLSSNWFAIGIAAPAAECSGPDYYQIKMEENGSNSNKLTITYTTPCTPDAPTSPTAESSSTSQIDLTWVAPTNCTMNATKIERSPDGSTGWTTIYNSTPKTSHSDTGLSSNEDYFYRISYQSVSPDLLWGATTSNVSDYTTPAQVVGLTATAQSDTQINTSWTASTGSGTVTYDVERRDGTQYGSVCSGFGAWSVVSNDQSGTTYNDTGLSTTTCYEYRVNSTNSDSTGAYSATATDTTYPSAPTSLSALTFSDTRIDLSWTAPVNSNVDGYKIERESPVGGGWSTLVADTGTTDVTYSDTGLSASTQYNYRVSALNGADSSVSSNTAEDTTQGVPAAPTGLTVTPVSETQLDLVWVAPSSDPALTGYKIERESPVGGGWSTLVADTGNTLIYYNNTGLTSGTEYNYRVSGINAIGTGSPSNTAYNDTIAGTPTGLTATATTSTNIDLSWTAPTPSGEINGYKIERESPVGGGWSTLVANTTTTSTAYSDSTVTGAVEYNYRVSAYTESNIAGNTSTASSDWTWAEVVTSFTASAEDDDQIDLDWTNPSGTLTGFKIERESPIGGGFTTLVNDTTTTQNWYNATGLSANTQYNFRVSAWSLGGAGDTATAFTNTTTTAPTSLIVHDRDHALTTGLDLEWVAPSPAPGVNGYKIERESPIGGGWSVLVANTSNTNLYYNDTGLVAGTFYNYRVSALNEFGSSESSNTYAFTPHRLPEAVDDLVVVTNELLQFVLSWTTPDNLYGTLSGYQVNYTTPAGLPQTVHVNNTGTPTTTITVSGLDPTTEHSWRVGVWTNHGGNFTGNIANGTLTSDLVIGDISIAVETNPDALPIWYELENVDSSTDVVQVWFDDDALGPIDCTVEHRLGGTTTNYTSLSETSSGDYAYHNFTVTNAGNDVLEWDCWDSTDLDQNNQYTLTQNLAANGTGGNANVPMFAQVNNFTDGLYGTDGELAGIDLMTMFIVIISMLGFNRTHPALGVGVMASLLGAAWYFEIIPWTSGMLGMMSLILVFSIGMGLKKR